MDGTILNSLAAAERVWGRWATRHGLDLAAFLPTMHGKRGIDTIAGLDLPG
ncbi:MAG TPA: HAD family hydrolase, partial [Pseudorhizobium sp.]|nr:HAD family hydrolase [Pseudorhizobium sp.]